jgi:hypothetical protein
MSFSGLLIPIPIAAPNLIWFLAPNHSQNTAMHDPASTYPILSFVETIGRVAVMAVPLFLTIGPLTLFDVVCLAVSALALGVYCACWVRYFTCKRLRRLLFQKLGFIPVPMAVAPTVYFLAFAFIGRSLAFGIITALFGYAHVFLCLKRANAA